MNPQNRHVMAQTLAYTLTDLQQHQLDFLNQIADQKNIGYGDKAAFRVKNNNGIKVVFQAKGATTPRKTTLMPLLFFTRHQGRLPGEGCHHAQELRL